MISPLSVAIQVPALHVNLFKRRLPGDARGNLFTIMGADITLKQTFDGYTNDLEFNRIKGSLNEVYMHPRTIGKKHLHDLPGSDVNESHYFGRIDIPATVRDKNGNVYMVTALGTPEKSVMYMATKLERVSIPGTVKIIDSYSFAGCIKLAIVGLDEGIEEIQKKAFWYCKLLRLNLPDSVRSINIAFPNCSILEHIEIGTGMREMKGAFMKCPSIKTVICKAQNPPEIDEKTFDDDIYRLADLFVPYSAFNKYKNHLRWGKFKNIYEIADTVPSDVQHYRLTHEMIDGIYYEFNFSYSLASVIALENGERYLKKEVVIPNSVKQHLVVDRIEKEAFKSAATKSINLPNTLSSIGNGAFSGSQLTSISLPDSLTKIGDSAFQGCASLNAVDIPRRVATIGQSAFEGCRQLERATLHYGLREIGARAFAGASALKEITIPSTVIKIGADAFSNIGLTSVTCMATQPPHIGRNQIFDASVLQNVVLRVPASAISTYQFHEVWGDFKRIEGVDNSSEVTNFLVNDIFYEIKDAAARIVHVSKIPINYKNEEVVIPSTVTHQNVNYAVTGINDNACEAFKIKRVIIPSSVETLGDSAFANMYDLEKVTFSEGLKSIGDNCFNGDTKLRQMSPLPETLIEIGRAAFKKCPLMDIKIPDSVNCIDPEAFMECQLQHVILGKGITTINNSVFEGAVLSEIFIPASVTNIDKMALYAGPIQTITCMAIKPPKLDPMAFGGHIRTKTILKVPADAVSAYRMDPIWGQFSTFVSIIDEEDPETPPASDNG